MKHLRNTLLALRSAQSRLRREEDGQIVVFTALAGLALVLMVSTIFNVGMVTGEKMKVQNAADAAAYSQAVWEARVLNFMAYTNRAIICHMVTIAFTTAMLSQQNFWNKAAKYGGSIPYIGALPRAVALFWNMTNMILQPRGIREGAYRWVQGCQALQRAVLTEYVWRSYRIPQKVAEEMDPAIKMNADADRRISLLTTGATMKQFGELTGFDYPNPVAKKSGMDFRSLKETYEESMDGFSRGSSFPRGITVYFPVFPPTRFRLRGKAVVEERKIRQQERFLIEVWEGFWGWDDVVDISVEEEVYDKLKLGDFSMFNAQKNFVQKEQNTLSVYSYAKKSAEDMLQIPLLDAETKQDIHAFARAEVFYWDPDRNRSKKLTQSYTRRWPPQPPREPNLFNPFWHARLAPADEVLSLLPFQLGAIVPVTH